jgi:hypothetical protein
MLHEISIWEENYGKWLSWNIRNPLEPLCPLISALNQALNGCAPWDYHAKYCRGWGKSIYKVKEGYLVHLSSLPLPQHSPIWKQIWHSESPRSTFSTRS